MDTTPEPVATARREAVMPRGTRQHVKAKGTAYPARGTITQVASCEWCGTEITSARHPVTVWVHATSGRADCDA